MSTRKPPRVLVVGDSYGVPQLLKVLPREVIVAIVGASNRPFYHDVLKNYAKGIDKPFVIQPKYSTNEYRYFTQTVQDLKPSILICHSYSMLIREDILQIVNYNAFNLHSALLPKNRGPNPIQWTIIKGEEFTGITIHYMDAKIDAGDIVAQQAIPIDFRDTWVTLNKKLIDATLKMLSNNIPKILKNKIVRIKQDECQATKNKRLTPESPRIQWETMSDNEIYNLIRAQVFPLKGAYIEKNEQRIYFDKFVEFEEISLLRKKYAI